jgi:TonB family protein
MSPRKQHRHLLTLLACLHAPALCHAQAASPPSANRPLVLDRVEIVRCPKPVWPRESYFSENTGDVVISFLVDWDGKVIDRILRKTSGDILLDRASLEGIAKCRFSPPLRDGKPVSGWTSIHYRWEIDGGREFDRRIKKMEAFRDKAAAGDADAIYELGIAYMGIGMPDQLNTGLRLLMTAADKKHPAALYALGEAVQEGRGTDKNETEAVDWYRDAAEHGDAKGQYALGEAYETGDHVKRNVSEAVKWYRKAAEQNEPRAQNAYGELLARGEGVKMDAAEAVKWFRKAAVAENAAGMRNLGIAYAGGVGVEKNPSVAVAWLREAAAKRDTVAEGFLGAMYLEGHGVAQNTGEAIGLLRRAALGGEALYQNMLGDVYASGSRTKADPAEAAIWYRRAANSGSAKAHASLAGSYETGRGVTRDENAAFGLYVQAAELGDEAAMRRLGDIYAKGELHQAVNAALAEKWRRKAQSAPH